MREPKIIHGDCLQEMQKLEASSIDAVVCDPPYHLTSTVERFGKEGAAPAKSDGATGVYARASRGFMGQMWDGGGIAFEHETWAQAFRALKPGGYLLAFGGTRTFHRMACAIEDAGFEIRDCIGWHYGSGFPKSLDVSKAIDRAAGAEREVVGSGGKSGKKRNAMAGDFRGEWDNTAPATDDARRWSGWGTALKPAWEPVVVARKPFEGTVAGNVLKHGTGAINVDGCRVAGAPPSVPQPAFNSASGLVYGMATGQGRNGDMSHATGRWPANLLLSHATACGETCAPGCPCAEMDGQSGQSKTPTKVTRGAGGKHGAYSPIGAQGEIPSYVDSGGASRFFKKLDYTEDDFPPFFYAPKASRSEREAGCGELPARSGAEAVEREDDSAGMQSSRAGAGRTASSVRNHHPTVKPIAVMRHLVRLVTPPGGTVLDPFTGSGTTGCAAVLEGVNFVGIEQSAEYVEIARARIQHAMGKRKN